jgi:hypothetical protein
MTTFEPADVRLTEQDGVALVELVVDAEEPAGTDWGVRVPIGAIAFDFGQPHAMRVNWRGVQP